jgi:hypothetical protein
VRRCWRHFHLGVHLMVQAPGCVLTPLCNQPSRDTAATVGNKEAAQRLVPTQDRRCLKTSSQTGMHPIGLASGRGVTSISAGHGAGCGLAGLEPAASSLSAITRSPLCNPAFSQVACDRRGRSNALLHLRLTSARTRRDDHWQGMPTSSRPQGDGAAGGRGSPIERVTETVVRLRARPGLCGRPVWWPARPVQR